MIDLEALSEAALGMEPLPTSAARLAALAGERPPELVSIVEVVELDPPLTASLLRAANSPWSAPRDPIASARDAVVRLGSGPVLTAALGVHLRTTFDRAVPEYGIDEGALWQHSVAASLAAEVLGRFVADLPTETPTAALLHDLGKIIISRFFTPEDRQAIDAARAAGASHVAAEREVLGVHHGELGALLVQHWALPGALVNGIAQHHDPLDEPVSRVALGVHVADVVAKRLVGDDDNDDPTVLQRVLAELELRPEAVDEVAETVRVRLGEVFERFGATPTAHLE